MRAAVIGAAGHLGNAVVRELLSRGYQVTACGRRSKPPAILDGLAVSYRPGDANSRGQLEEWISGQDIVVDAAAPYPLQLTPLDGRAEMYLIAAAERRTRALIESIKRVDARLVYISSFVTVTSPLGRVQALRSRVSRMIHPYFLVKVLIESLIVDACRHGLEAVIVNPTACFGPWDSRPPELCVIPQVLKDQMLPISSNSINAIDVREVALTAMAALDARIFGEPILVAGTSVRATDLFTLICELGGVPPPTFSMTPLISGMGSLSLEIMLGLVRQRTPIPSISLMLANEFSDLPVAVRQFELGIEPRPLSSTIADAIKWYRQIGAC